MALQLTYTPQAGGFERIMVPLLVSPISINGRLRYSLWMYRAIGFFRAIGEERSEGVAGLVPISIALGALYVGTRREYLHINISDHLHSCYCSRSESSVLRGPIML